MKYLVTGILGLVLFIVGLLICLVSMYILRPWVDQEQRAQEILIGPSDLSEKIVHSYLQCKDSVKLNCKDPVPVASNQEIKISIDKVTSVHGLWRGSDVMFESEPPITAVVLPGQENDWGTGITGLPSEKAEEVFVKITFDTIPKEYLHTTIFVTVRMEYVYPDISGVNTFTDKTETGSRRVAFYVVTGDEYRFLAGNSNVGWGVFFIFAIFLLLPFTMAYYGFWSYNQQRRPIRGRKRHEGILPFIQSRFLKKKRKKRW